MTSNKHVYLAVRMDLLGDIPYSTKLFRVFTSAVVRANFAIYFHFLGANLYLSLRLLTCLPKMRNQSCSQGYITEPYGA